MPRVSSHFSGNLGLSSFAGEGCCSLGTSDAPHLLQNSIWRSCCSSNRSAGVRGLCVVKAGSHPSRRRTAARRQKPRTARLRSQNIVQNFYPSQSSFILASLDGVTPVHEWQLQDPKNRLSEPVRRASDEGPQIVTGHGKRAAVLISAAAYDRPTRPTASFTDFLLSGPDWPDCLIHTINDRSRDTGRTEGL
jgi:prevent-host-death family protein